MGNLLRKELAERLRLTIWMAALSPVLLAAIAWLLTEVSLDAGGEDLSHLITTALSVQLLLLALVALLPTFAQERERDTLDLLCCQPLPRGQVWLAKTSAGLLRLVVMAAAPLLLASSMAITLSVAAVLVTGTAALLAAGCVVLLASSLAPATYSAALFSFAGLPLHAGLLLLVVQEAWVDAPWLGLVGLLVTAPPCLLTSYLVVAHPRPRWLMALPPFLQEIGAYLYLAACWAGTAAAGMGIGYLVVHIMAGGGT